jgi:hypothetical protein
MKRIIVIALACAFAPLATAQMYKSVGPDGKTVYSDQPPANADTKQINVRPSSSPPAQKSAVERDKEAEKLRVEAREKAKKAEATAKYNQINETRCAQARSEYQVYTEGGRLGKTNEKGERVLMNDAEIESERNRVRLVMEEACKK